MIIKKIFNFEVSGYPSKSTGIPADIWKLVTIANRTYEVKKKDEVKRHANIDSIEQIEYELECAKANLMAESNGSGNFSSNGNMPNFATGLSTPAERIQLRSTVRDKAKLLAGRRAFIYDYVTSVHYELKYSSINNDIFSRVRNRVDDKIGSIVPDSVQKFTAVYENLLSDNTEDWSNAVHSCRRILQDTADSLYPPREDVQVGEGRSAKTIKLGPDNYINRLIQYVTDNSDSERYEEIVGSHLKYLGERLDSIFKAAQKGSHDEITSQDEADRYVLYTYMVVGDILHLQSDIDTKLTHDEVKDPA